MYDDDVLSERSAFRLTSEMLILWERKKGQRGRGFELERESL